MRCECAQSEVCSVCYRMQNTQAAITLGAIKYRKFYFFVVVLFSHVCERITLKY